MLPIAPLMIEHRLIERMIRVMQDELIKMETSKKVDPVFIDTAVDFIRTYADQTHHGKEEDILFRELKKKSLPGDLAKIMEELVEEHKLGRKNTAELVSAKEAYLQGESSALAQIQERFATLAGFYPKHIEKEDKRFFVPVMMFFSKAEQDAMLAEGQEFDRKMIHKKYANVIGMFESTRKLAEPPDDAKWLQFM